jgi:hypothetical protein
MHAPDGFAVQKRQIATASLEGQAGMLSCISLIVPAAKTQAIDETDELPLLLQTPRPAAGGNST